MSENTHTTQPISPKSKIGKRFPQFVGMLPEHAQREGLRVQRIPGRSKKRLSVVKENTHR